MTWALILHFSLTPPGGSTAQTTHYPAGLMQTHDTCAIAGMGMAMILQAANPGLTVRFTCLQQGEAA